MPEENREWSANWCQELYELKAREILLYGRAMGLSHSEAEDVLQDVFVALLALEQTPKKPGFYAIRAFRNRAINYRRSLWRRVAREFESVRWFDRASGEDSDLEEAAMKRLTTLPPEQREVIVLKIWHQYTFEEIATLLDLSPNTAAGRYRYGIEKLRVTLRETTYEPEEQLGEPFAVLETAPTFCRS